MNKTPLILIFTIAATAIISGCVRKPAKWDANMAVPLFKTNLSLSDINNSYLLNTASDSSYDLVYDALIYSARLTNVKTPDTTINTSFTLRRLKLSDRTIVQQITLGQINPLFNLLDGQTADVPAQDQSNLNPVDIDASPFFETATLDSGYLDISLKNDLPVKITLLVFQISNGNDNSIVATDSFINIAKGGSATKSINLAGKTVNKALKGTIKRLVTEASPAPVLIDAKKGVTVTLSVRKLRPNNAIAAFPNQTVIDQDAGLVLDMGGPQVKFFKVKTGKLHIILETTIQENMTMFFDMPSATINGTELQRIVKMPGAVGGKVERREEIIDMAGYLMDFRGKNPAVNDTFNTYHQILKVTLDSSGRKVKVTLKDSIRIYYRMESLTPEYAIGYLGNSVNSSKPSTTTFGLFKGLDGNIALQNFTASILMQNYVGAEGRIKVKKLEGENIFSGNKVTLNATPLAGDIFVLPPPFTKGAYTEKKIVLDGSNSNIKSFVELLPQRINYDLEVETNPHGNISNWKDFIFDDSRVDISLRLECPATFAVGGLNLRDTQPFSFTSIKNLNRVKSAKLIMDVENGYPFEVGMEITFLGAGFQVLGKADFIGGNTIAPGKTDAFGKALANSKSQLIISVPRDKVWMLQKAENVAIKAMIKSAGGTKQKIYNTYKIKISTNGQFEYEANL